MKAEHSSSTGIDRYVLNSDERQAIDMTVGELGGIGPGFDECDLEDILVKAQELPSHLRRALYQFRRGLRPAGLVLSNLPFTEAELGPTPSDWTSAAELGRCGIARDAETLLLLISALLGDIFAFGTQHSGRLLVDVFPIKGHEFEQLGSASKTELDWHNEDAFHPFRADFILLFCLRNPQRVATRFASINSLDIPEPARGILFEERFPHPAG